MRRFDYLMIAVLLAVVIATAMVALALPVLAQKPFKLSFLQIAIIVFVLRFNSFITFSQNHAQMRENYCYTLILPQINIFSRAKWDFETICADF